MMKKVNKRDHRCLQIDVSSSNRKDFFKFAKPFIRNSPKGSFRRDAKIGCEIRNALKNNQGNYSDAKNAADRKFSISANYAVEVITLV